MKKLVCESLDSFNDSKYEALLLNESFVNEGIDIERLKNIARNIKDKKRVIDNTIEKINSSTNWNYRKYLAGVLIALASVTGAVKMASGEDIEAVTTEIADRGVGADEMKFIMADEKKDPLVDQVSIENRSDVIHNLNAINPQRFSHDQIDQYDQYDEDIAQAVRELKFEGQKPDPKLIKAIMLVETGMKPVKNRLGYEGFPQTKKHIVDDINQRYGQNFTMGDMYDAKQSAKFIHYMIQAMHRSKFVKNDLDAVAAYNWGLGNYSRYKMGKEKLPKETADYMDLVSTLVKA